MLIFGLGVFSLFKVRAREFHLLYSTSPTDDKKHKPSKFKYSSFAMNSHPGCYFSVFPPGKNPAS